MRSITISKSLALAIGFVAFVVVAAIDLITPPISLVLLQLVPVLFVTWHAGIRWGLGLSIAMTAVEITVRMRSGNWVPSGLLYIDITSDFFAVLLLVWIQTLLKKAYEQQQNFANHDNLTKVLNRAGFYRALEDEIDRCKRYGTKPFSLVYFDCDNFKYVNDSLGHHVGDTLLSLIAAIAKRNLRKVDSVCRIGGDEFAILLPECDEPSASAAVTHLKAALDGAMRAHGWPVGFSIGVAVVTDTTHGVDKTIEFADTLMYEAKKSGKNCMVLRNF